MGEITSFEKSLLKLKFFFALTGLFLENKQRTLGETIGHRSILILNFIWLNSDLIGELFWLNDGFKKGKNLTELTFVAPCFTLEILAHLKSLSLLIYEKELHQLVENLKLLEAVERTRKRRKEETEIVNAEIKFMTRVINLLNIFNILMVVFFFLGPMVFIGVQYALTRDITQSEAMFAMLDVYPFDSLHIRYWPFLFIHQIWTESIVLLEICAADFFFFTCCTYLRVHFILLHNDIENYIHHKERASFRRNENSCRSNFVQLITRHQMLISSVALLETLYAKSTLFNFISSSFLICLTGFNVTTTADIGVIMTFATFLFMSLLQIFFLCYFGDTLLESSLGISTAAYKSQWYAANDTTKSLLLFVHMRAQSPCKVTAYGFAEVNLMAFMGILRAAWSYFALLKTIYG